MTRRLIVASASPRRHDLLRAAGFEFAVVPADIDESPLAGEDAATYVERLASAKAEAVAAGLRSGARGAGVSDVGVPDVVVLGADTIVELDGALLGKPVDTADAITTLRRLRGRTHRVMTAVAVVTTGTASRESRITSAIRSTEVRFRALTDSEIEGYVATGEPLDKAGSYAIQGAGGAFVERIIGDYDNVVGLPVEVTRTLLRDAGLEDSPS